MDGSSLKSLSSKETSSRNIQSLLLTIGIITSLLGGAIFAAISAQIEKSSLKQSLKIMSAGVIFPLQQDLNFAIERNTPLKRASKTHKGVLANLASLRYQEHRILKAISIFDEKYSILASSDPLSRKDLGTKFNFSSTEAEVRELDHVYYVSTPIIHKGSIHGYFALEYNVKEFGRSFTNPWMFYFFVFCSVFLLGIGFVLLCIQYSVSSPLKKLCIAITDNVELTPITYTRGPGEVELLYKSTNQLFHNLSEAQDRLIKARENEAIAQTTQMLAHDVRKPFSMLQGVLSLIKHSKSHQDILAIATQADPEINRAITSVNGMIQDIMEVGFEANFMIEAVNPETILETTITDTFRYLEKADVNLSYTINNNHRLNIDVLKVSRVFANIIGNGVQAMGYKGDMWFHLNNTAKEGFTKFTIGNSGSYISPEKLDLLFDAFFTSDKKGGTGLGLAIAKKVVEGHGGEIWCTSSRDKGTEFHFTLPSLPLPSTYRGSLPRTSAAIREQFKIDVGDKSAEEDAPQNEALFEQAIIDAQASNPKPISILIVDDESLYITVLRNQITSNPDLSQHIEITTASSGEEALQQVHKNNFDIIIQDVDMGGHGLDGFDTVKAIRELKSIATICIHSNRGGPQYHKLAIESGAEMFIGKTMPREQLLRMIYSTLGDPDDLLAKPVSTSSTENKEGTLLLVEDNVIFTSAWKSLDSNISSYTHPERILSDIDRDREILANCRAIVIDNNYDDLSDMTGYELARELQQRGVKIPLFLSTCEDVSPEDIDGLFTAAIPKNPTDGLRCLEESLRS